MRWFGVLFLLAFLHSTLAQIRVSTEVITNLKRFSDPKQNLDITDLFSRTDQMVRIHGQYQFNEDQAAWTQLDFDTSQKLIAFGLGYQHQLLRSFYGLVAFQTNSYYLSYPTGVSAGYFQDHALAQLVVGGGWQKQVEMFEFTLQGSIHYGTSSQESIRRVTGFSTNLLRLESHDFHIRDIKSIRLNPQIRIQLTGPRNKLYLTYQFVWRMDWLKFKNDYQVFEWTLDRLVDREKYIYKQEIRHDQHHIGLTMDIQWQ